MLLMAAFVTGEMGGSNSSVSITINNQLPQAVHVTTPAVSNFKLLTGQQLKVPFIPNGATITDGGLVIFNDASSGGNNKELLRTTLQFNSALIQNNQINTPYILQSVIQFQQPPLTSSTFTNTTSH